MKKQLILAFAALSLAACVQEEVVTVPQTDAITFDQAYIDNATRAAEDPSTTTASIDAFDVWAFMKEYDGTVLVDEDVKKVGNMWTYANTQYWTPLNNYYFAALAPMNSANVKETLASGDAAKLGLGTIAFTNVDGSEDLLYAATMVTAPRYEDLKLNNMPPVKFEFSHLLSKVKFTFTNGFTTDNAYIVVRDLQMVAPKTGTIDLAVANWKDNDDWKLGTETLALQFGDVKKLAMGNKAECAVERLTIPTEATQEYNITFKIDLYMGSQLAYTFDKTTTVTGVAFEMGKAYNLTAEINPENLEIPAIEFDVIVEDWDVVADIPAHVGKTLYVNDATEFAAAVNDPEVAAIVLNNDIELGNTTLTRAGEEETVISKSFVLDGNGKTLTYTGSGRAIDIVSDVENKTDKNVTIKNVTINCTASYVERGINYNANGTLVLDGVTLTGTVPTYAVNFPGKADNAVVTITDCDLTGNIALNVWGENMSINVENSVLTSVDKSTVEGYSAVKLNNDGSTVANGTVISIKNSEVTARDENGEPSCAFYDASDTGVITVDEATDVVGTSSVQVAIVYYTNNNNFYGCTSLADAIAKAVETNAAGVRVTRDIKLDAPVAVAKGETVVIDLNGHNITMESTSEENVELFIVNGNLNVIGEGTISLTGDNFPWNSSYRYTAINIRETGVVTLGNGVEVICEASKDGKYGMSYAVDIYTTGTLNVDGASLHSNYIAVRCFYGASVVNVYSGSTITSSNKNYGIWLQNATGAKITIADDVKYTLEGSYGIYIFGE